LRDSMVHGGDAWEASVVANAHALALVERRLGSEPRALNDEWSGRHRAFHLSLYGGCSSPMLLDLVDVLFDKAERYRRWSAQHRQQPRQKHQEHQSLTSAALARDTDRAVELLRRHIGRTERLVASILAGTSADSFQ
jgi:GntR family transcriptional regulator, carbon starvation induced regulator